jgi:hypothetical protein
MSQGGFRKLHHNQNNRRFLCGQAPEPQKHALWMLVGVAMQRRLNNRPVWLSTAGAGVSWLHVRLDDRPKYYGYRPYRETLAT